ncbi:hypothetical protein TanjilG_14632 [Lupinus angustifolius]|uniref:adenylate kinase n=1 Tax=Lupinus angustifolius TaxID=3871 RepID=A0A1J7HGX3_LUPAN|nr:PREDICTED: adenylate kinase 1, chloroplastic-like [Lupinus angustifolius]OIW01633.1 hypothetical protein TanjilG_14632 [Lupinus angustifolius]
MAAITRHLTNRTYPISSLTRRCLSSALPSETNNSHAPPYSSFHLKPRVPPPEDLKNKHVQWVFLGCPGVGKGTYASRLSNLIGVPHIATGDLLREQLASSTSLSSQLSETVKQGQLVSDEVIISLLSKRLTAGEAKGESGFILDGFPRTVKQAEILEGVTEIDLVINLKLREDVLLEKCLGRRICSQCGGNFNVASININAENGNPGIIMAPLLPPANCMSKLTTRSDDTEVVVKERLRIYNEMSRPVEEFYRIRGKLLEFDLPGGIPESWPKLLQALNLYDYEDKQPATA